jgi:hypothetical protein
MEKLLWIWISDKQVIGDNVNSTLIRQKPKWIFDLLNAAFYLCLFTHKNELSAPVDDFPGMNYFYNI